MKSHSPRSRINHGGGGEVGGRRRGKSAGLPPCSPRPPWFNPDSAIERETEAIVPLWTAECIVNEAGRWLGVHLPEELPAFLAAKAERCFAGHRSFTA